MNHLGFVAASYALAIAVPLAFAAMAARRLGRARRLLAALDQRGRR